MPQSYSRWQARLQNRARLWDHVWICDMGRTRRMGKDETPNVQNLKRKVAKMEGTAIGVNFEFAD